MFVSSYSETFKAEMVSKMLAPMMQTPAKLALETGVAKTTLWRWRNDALINDGMKKTKHKGKWTPAERLRLIVAANGLSDEDLGVFLRREGVHEAELQRWREDALDGLAAKPAKGGKSSPESKRIKELERELHRKDRALAEASAILVLKKKAAAIWGARTTSPTGRPGKNLDAR